MPRRRQNLPLFHGHFRPLFDDAELQTFTADAMIVGQGPQLFVELAALLKHPVERGADCLEPFGRFESPLGELLAGAAGQERGQFRFAANAAAGVLHFAVEGRAAAMQLIDLAVFCRAPGEFRVVAYAGAMQKRLSPPLELIEQPPVLLLLEAQFAHPSSQRVAPAD